MSLSNINYSPRFTKHLVASQAFTSKPLIVVDVGARGGFESHWAIYGNQVQLIGFEVDEEECKKLNQKISQKGSKNHFYSVALHKNKMTRPFYVTAYLPSAGFYPADTKLLQRFLDEANLTIVKTIDINTVDFNSFAKENHIDSVDFIKLDTEGSELDVLEGANEFLKKSVIGLSVEVNFFQWHKGQPIFSDVDSFLRPLGFKLFDLTTYRHGRKTLPQASSPFMPTAKGQVIWGQALYLRDGADEIKYSTLLEDGWSDTRILKLVSIMELFCLNDCAIELIQVAKQKGFFRDSDINLLIDMLVPSNAERRIASYIGRAKLSLGKFLPQSIRRKIYNFLIKIRDFINKLIR